MTRTLIFICLMSSTIHAFATTEAPIEIIKNYTIYKVTGTTLDEIENSFDKRVGAEHYQSDYDGQAIMGYEFDVDEKTCVISNMSLEVEYILPQIQLHTSKMELGDEYKEYMAQLYRHETIHCAITLEALHQIRKVATQTHFDCASRINTIMFIEDTIQGIHEEFDRVTNHGWQHQNSNLGQADLMHDCKIAHEPIIVYQ